MPLLLVTVFLNIAGFSLILPMLPFYGKAFEASSFEVACLFAAYSLGGFFGEIFWGRRSDVIGRKPVLMLTTALAALSYVAFAFAPTFAVALLVRIASGFFSGTFGVVQGVIADITPPQDRAKNMGYFGAAFNLGFASGPALGGLLADTGAGLSGFRLPILMAAALAASASLWTVLALPETRPTGSDNRAPPSYREALRFVSGNALLWRLFLIAFCGIAAFASMEAILGLWTELNFEWTAREVGLTFLAIGGTGLLVQTMLIGPLVHRFGEVCIILIGLLILAMAMLSLPLLRTPMTTVICMSLLMAGHSLAFPNAGALVSRNTPATAQGSVMGLNMASNALARIVAPPVFGLIFFWSPDAPYFLCAFLALAMAGVTASLLTRVEKTTPL